MKQGAISQTGPTREAFDRLPPQATDVEGAVLGAMMLEKEAVARTVEIIDDSCFYSDKHRHIYTAIVALYERDEPADLVTVSEELKKKKMLDAVGGPLFLTSLVESTPTAANVAYHAKIVLEKSVLRKLITTATQIVAESYEGMEDPHDLLDRAEQMIFGLAEKRLRKGFDPLRTILHSTFEAIERFHDRKGHVIGVASGFDALDELTAGFQPSDFIVVAGRPSMGKTAFALCVARNAAVKDKVPVAIFSLEMASNQLAQRMLCAEARVDAHSVRTGRLPDDDWSRLSISVGALAEAPIFIDDTPAQGVLELRSKARRLMVEHNIGLIVIDYLQLMKGPKGAENRQQEISEISRSLKAMAKELNVPVMALSQLSRAVEVRGGEKRPILSDLRESGAIEQDADMVLFIYRPEVYGRKDERTGEAEGVAEVIIGKQRNGPVGTVKLMFKKEYAKFEELTLAEGPSPFGDF